jgi:hypothetical protein
LNVLPLVLVENAGAGLKTNVTEPKSQSLWPGHFCFSFFLSFLIFSFPFSSGYFGARVSLFFSGGPVL